MTTVLQCVFWASFAAIVYTYLGYPVILFVLYGLAQVRRDFQHLVARIDRRASDPCEHDLPPVTLLFAAYNEERYIERKLENTRALSYPRDKLQVVIVSDGSTDATNAVLRSVTDPDFCVIFPEQRSGKTSALNLGLQHVRHGIIVLTDASTLFDPDAIRKLVRHFRNPGVGAVCGALRFEATGESQRTEGVYWKYETILRLMEARLGATLTPSGAIYAIRRDALDPFPPGTLIDDFVATMNVRNHGLAVLYDPEARATDFAASDITGEFRRRVRIATGSFRALASLAKIPLPGATLFAFFSHKVLRWFVPVFAIALLLGNIALLTEPHYRIALAVQAILYLWAAAGYAWRDRLRGIPFVSLGYFLVAMNFAFLVGLVQALTPGKEATWQRVS